MALVMVFLPDFWDKGRHANCASVREGLQVAGRAIAIGTGYKCLIMHKLDAVPGEGSNERSKGSFLRLVNPMLDIFDGFLSQTSLLL